MKLTVCTSFFLPRREINVASRWNIMHIFLLRWKLLIEGKTGLLNGMCKWNESSLDCPAKRTRFLKTVVTVFFSFHFLIRSFMQAIKKSITFRTSSLNCDYKKIRMNGSIQFGLKIHFYVNTATKKKSKFQQHSCKRRLRNIRIECLHVSNK